MKKVIVFLFLLPNFLCQCAEVFQVSEKTCIIIDEHPSAAARLAATELHYFLKTSTGIDLPIRTQISKAYKNAIYVGESSYTREMGFDLSQLQEQEYIIDITPEQIVLLGTDYYPNSSYADNQGRDNNGIVPAQDRIRINYAKATGQTGTDLSIELPAIFDAQGSCYAVYDFLETFMGIRFYGPHPVNLIIPAHRNPVFVSSRIRRAPVFKYRHGTYTFDWPMLKEQYLDAGYEMQQLFLRRLRFGGRKWAANHAFTSYQDRFLKKNPQHPELFESYHPEYFATGQDGDGQSRQFCYTNPAFIRQVARDACDYFAGNGLKGNSISIGDYFAIVPLDNANWCKCKQCQQEIAIDRKNQQGEQFSCGKATYYHWNFIHNVAREVAQSYPDKKISALAYHVYAYPPDSLELLPSVSVAPCLHPRNYWVPAVKENDHRLYREWVEESKKSGRDLFLWNYLCFPTERGLLIGHFNVFPGFSIHTLEQEIKMYAKDRIKGVYLCGIGEQLDFYIIQKLYDRPELKADQLMEEFFRLYFGKAAPAMQRFYTCIEDRYSNPENYPDYIRKENAHFHQTEELAWKYLGTEKVMQELESCIREARAAQLTTTERQRLETWEKGVWDYMVSGKKAYLEKQQSINTLAK